MLGTTPVKEGTSTLQGGKTSLFLVPVSICFSVVVNFREEMHDINSLK